MVTVFMGRKAEDWAAIDDVMRSHDIPNGVALGARLKPPKSKRDPMDGRVLVVDSKNPERVLGSIPRPGGNSPRLDGGDRYRMALMGRLATCFEPDFSPMSQQSISYIDFGFRAVNWTVVLTTGAPLDQLVQIKDFRLPGEDAEQAYTRQMYAR